MPATSTRTAAKKAPTKKTTAKKTAKKTVKKSAAKPARRPVTLNGRPAKNRHFLVDRELLAAASDKCASDGVMLSDVLRHGLVVYGDGAPPEDKVKDALDLLPRKTRDDLKRVWKQGDSDTINDYLAALHRAGWPVRAIAASLVETGVVKSMTRQAVSLRILRASDTERDDLPPVPDLGPRRPIVSARKGQKGQYKPAKKNRDTSHDVGFRVEDDVYAAAVRRAKHEGAMMSGVLDAALDAYLAGEYDKALKKGHDA